jgi:hypothetical protein
MPGVPLGRLEGWLFVDATERDAWLEGLVVSPVDGSRPTF